MRTRDFLLKTYHPISLNWSSQDVDRSTSNIGASLACGAVWTWIQNIIHAVSHIVWHVKQTLVNLFWLKSASVISFNKGEHLKIMSKFKTQKSFVAMISSSHLTLLQFDLQINFKHLCTHHLHRILHPLSCPYPYYLTRMKNAHGAPRLPRISIPYRKLYTHCTTFQKSYWVRPTLHLT